MQGCTQGGPDIYEKVKSDVGSMQETLKMMDFIGPRTHQRIRNLMYHDLPALLKEHNDLQKKAYRPTEYEYGVEVTEHDGKIHDVSEYGWYSDKDSAQSILDAKLNRWKVYGVDYTARTVKRRKAGKVEDV